MVQGTGSWYGQEMGLAVPLVRGWEVVPFEVVEVEVPLTVRPFSFDSGAREWASCTGDAERGVMLGVRLATGVLGGIGVLLGSAIVAVGSH